MARVPSPVVIKKDGIEFISKVDRTIYLLDELTRAALNDVGKFLRRRMLAKVRKLKGLRKGRLPTIGFRYKVKKINGTYLVKVGIAHNTWYGVHQELGTNKSPKRSILRETVMENIEEIRRIEGAYLAEIEDENRALGIINNIDESEDLDDS